MYSDRTTAALVGALFIIGTVAGAASMIVTSPILGADYIAQVAAHPNRMMVGVLCLLTMGIVLAMVPVVFYPVGRRYNEALAMGYVVFRGALETVTYMVGAFAWLALVTVSKESTGGAVSEPVRLAGVALRGTEGWVWNQMTPIFFTLGAMMFYYLLFQSRLIPRWLSLWGLVGAVVYFAVPLLGMFGIGAGFLMAPLALQEMVMGLWLIVKGFNPEEQRVLPMRTADAVRSARAASAAVAAE